jgi:hypothetical protein
VSSITASGNPVIRKRVGKGAVIVVTRRTRAPRAYTVTCSIRESTEATSMRGASARVGTTVKALPTPHCMY